jgi:hypothetical protein
MSRGRAVVVGSLLVLHPLLVLPLLLLVAQVLVPVLRLLVPLLGLPVAVLGIVGLVVQLVQQLAVRAGLIGGVWWEARRDHSLAGVALFLTASEVIAALVLGIGIPAILIAVAGQLRDHPWLALLVIAYLAWFARAVVCAVRDALRKVREQKRAEETPQ